MFRLLGFLIGSAISIAVILLVTGIPDFHLKNPEIDQQRFDAAVEKLMARKIEAEHVAENIASEVVEVAETLQENIKSMPQETPAPVDLPATARQLQPVDAEDSPPVPATELVFSESGDAPLPVDDMQWYSFWNPFRSEIAASGFVSQLEKVTGLDYRVVKVKSGVYEVAFSYDDDTERRYKLSQISAATGLDLPDS